MVVLNAVLSSKSKPFNFQFCKILKVLEIVLHSGGKVFDHKFQKYKIAYNFLNSLLKIKTTLPFDREFFIVSKNVI